MTRMSTSMVKPILETLYELRSEMVPCFIGDPGIGKTQGLYEFAKEKGVNVVTFILSNTVPSEVSGIRMPDKESKRMEVFDDMRMASLKDGDILFFDEILEAPPMLWSACLTLIQDRIMASGRKLPDVFIVAASNNVASPGIIPASTRDRFQFIELKFDSYNWRKWFKKKHGVDPEDITTFIQGDSDQYNILTPRRVEKLYMWLKESERGSDDWYTKTSVIASMFDSVICNKLAGLISFKSGQAQIKEAILNSNIKVNKDVVEKDFDAMTLNEILDYLQQQPEWEGIQYILATTQFKNQEDKAIEY